MSPPTPAGRAAARYRLPVDPPTRELLIGSLASIAGACQLFAWALASLPTFFLVFGVVLVGIGLGFALAAVLRHRRLRWIAYVGPESLTVVNGQRRTVLPWADVRAVRYANSRLEVTGGGGERLCTLRVDQTRPAHEAAQVLERSIAAQLASSA
ncbi:hypothetical protein GCM10009616_38750 [Microlunatus lacustris]